MKTEAMWVFTVLFAMMLILGGCSVASTVAEGPTPTVEPSAVPPTPSPLPTDIPPEEAVMRTIETFYHDHIRAAGKSFAEGSYRASPLLAPELVSAIDEMMEHRELGSGDPFLCAQDVPLYIVIEEVTVDGEQAVATVSTDLSDHSFQPVLRQTEGGWQIVDVKCPALGGLSAAEARDAGGSVPVEPPAEESAAPPEGWNAYLNERHGFTFAFPTDWELDEHEVQVEEDGNPLDLMINFSGDPANPPPVQVTVTEGPWEDFSRIFTFEMVSLEDWELNGNGGYVILNSYDHVNYVFEHPANPDLRVVFDAPAGYQEEDVRAVLDTFRWLD